MAGIALGTALPIGMVAAFAVGVGSAAIVHLLFGSPAGRLTLGQVADALAELGVEASGLRQAPLEPRGAAVVTAEGPGGRSLLVKIYGRDAWDGQLLASAWSALWYRGDTPHLALGRRAQVEHEAFVTLLAERAGVRVLPVVAAGMASERDGLLVTETSGRPLDRLDPDEVDDQLLEGIWGNAGRLHALGVAHRRLDASRILIRPDRTPAFGDFAGAAVAADDADLAADRARVLVATALAAGPQRAASAALAALGDDTLTQVLPLLQPAAVERQTRHAIADQDWDLDDLRKACAEAAGAELPKLAQLRRVSLRSIGVVVLIGLVAYAIISALADVGLANLIDEFKAADLAWLAVALALSPVIPMAKAFATLGASFRPLRFGPVLMLDYAIQFIALAVPSSAARLALDIRFFGRNGIDAGGAVSISAITSVCGFVVQVLLIVMISLSGLASLDAGERRHRHVLDGRLVRVRRISPAGPDRGPGGGRRDRHGGGAEVPEGGHPGRPEVSGHARLAGLLGRDGAARPAVALEGRDGRCGQARSAGAPGHHPRALPPGVRVPRHHGRADPGEQHRRPVRGVHARTRRHGGRRGRLHGRTRRLGCPQRHRDVHRDRLPDGHLLPPTDLGRDRHALAPTALLPLNGPLAGSFRGVVDAAEVWLGANRG